ncbi:hypothetical protein DNTS_014524 [Danionella cerebrum]|uniref:ST3 beta-galactoside alpha-2,3-sialyltransferase 1 n=1 Tax=Danionella cerebrum TaxID=2873325 RepID=A0A553QCB5_9TELE|nr:hypothetical protein DNTS_014524 [Danionella translucida]TRY87563.1 hypothetical protein DNTS_014524 [Danionella translucida]
MLLSSGSKEKSQFKLITSHDWSDRFNVFTMACCKKQLKTIFIVLLSTTICTVTINKFPYELIARSLMNNRIAEHMFHRDPCACVERCLAASRDPWFLELFRGDIPPLLSRENSNISDDIFNWWQGHYRDAGSHRCRTCAVVGNSGNLLGSKYGLLIDNHEFVMRMNKAPIEGFEKDVGSRTTHRIMYPETATHLDNSTHLLLLPFKTLDIQWVTSALSDGSIKRTRFKVIDKLRADKNKAMVMHPAFMYYVHNTWLHIGSQRSYPSTGFLVLMFALHVCDEISVFGFGANTKGTWHHYFESMPQKFRLTGHHPGQAEHEIISELQQRKLITLYTGW